MLGGDREDDGEQPRTVRGEGERQEEDGIAQNPDKPPEVPVICSVK